MARYSRFLLVGGLGTIVLSGCGMPVGTELAAPLQRFQLQPPAEQAAVPAREAMGRMMSGSEAERSTGSMMGSDADMQKACQEHHAQP